MGHRLDAERPRVAVVGSINLDLTFAGAPAPEAGQTTDGATYDELLGGKGANQATAVAAAGAVALMIGRVGDDEAGETVLRLLRDHGVDDAFVTRSPGRRTGRAAILVDPDGENRIVVANGANAELGEDDVRGALGAMASAGNPPVAVVVSAEVPASACSAAIEWAAAHGVPAVLNVAPVRRLTPTEVAGRPVVVVNRGEAAELTGEDRPKRSVRLLARLTGGAAVVTDGPEGAFVVDGAEVTHVAADRVVAVDTTGAGDTFCGTLAVHLARGAHLAEAARLAGAAAAAHVAAGRSDRRT